MTTQPQQQQQMPPALKQAIENTDFLRCKSCDCMCFEIVHMVKAVSLASVGRIGEYLPVQVPVYRCSDCGDVLKINEHGTTEEDSK